MRGSPGFCAYSQSTSCGSGPSRLPAIMEARRLSSRAMRLGLPGGGRALKAIHFGGWQEKAPSARLRLAYRLATDDWRDARDIQLVVEHLEPA